VHGADDSALERARIELARRLRAREAELQEAVFTYVRSAVPDVIADGDARLAAGLRETIAVCIDCGLASIERGVRWSGARSREQRRAELAHRLLADEPLNAGELAELEYDLDGWHLGVIATGTQASQAAKATRGLAAGLGCELLPVPHGRDAVWAWVGGSRRIAFADVERALSIGGHAGVSLAVGEPAKGLEGWRQTHREAMGALLVARSWPRPLTRYLDVAPHATALQDEAFADSLIETYLSPLDGMRIGGQAARRTLGALLEKAHNVSSAASALNIDRSTVHRHRNEIERRLGCQLHERRVEIEVALRIEGLRQRRDGEETGAPAGACAACC
jgi:GGDEF-like domain/PucR C-terminal helix-turn-helix domain